jgi:hypothetical protein
VLKRAQCVGHTTCKQQLRYRIIEHSVGPLLHRLSLSLSRNAIRVYTLSSRVHLLSEYVSIRCLTFEIDKKKTKKEEAEKSIDKNDESKLNKLE